VCKKYIYPHGMGPHMVKHRVQSVRSADLVLNVDDLLAKAALLRKEADQIEAAVKAALALRKAYA
jgi:hypothetical protein